MSLDDHIADHVMDEFERLEASGDADAVNAVYAAMTVLNRCHQRRRRLYPLAKVLSRHQTGETVNFRIFPVDGHELLIAHYPQRQDDFLAIDFGPTLSHPERRDRVDELKDLWSDR